MAGIPFGICMGLFAGVLLGIMFGARMGLLAGLLVAAIAGPLFGISLAAFFIFFVAVQKKKFLLERSDWAIGKVLHEGPANHLSNGEGAGGWLCLTETHLIFRSHRLNLHPHETKIGLWEIVEARPVRTAGLFSNGLEVATTEGMSQRFVVEDHKRWSTEIAQARQAARVAR